MHVCGVWLDKRKALGWDLKEAMATWVSSFRVEEIWAWKRARGEDRITDSLVGGSRVGSNSERDVLFWGNSRLCGKGWGVRFPDQTKTPPLLSWVGRKLFDRYKTSPEDRQLHWGERYSMCRQETLDQEVRWALHERVVWPEDMPSVYQTY